MTQQQVADELVKLGFEFDRVSVTRVEGGRQNPGIVVLEAIARIIKAPSVSAMTDYPPEQWASIQSFIDMDPQQRDLALRLAETASRRQ